MKLLAIILVTIITACTTGKNYGLSQIEGENYTVHVMKLQGANNGTSGYKVRVLPTQKILDEQGKQLQEALWYQIDSCFYITKDDAIIKPDLVQPIANGVVNCYEYMLVFNDVPALVGNGEMTFVFNDRHITREKYLIRLF